MDEYRGHGYCLNQLETRAQAIVDELRNHIVEKRIQIDDFLIKPTGYKSGSKMPKIDSSFKEFKKDDQWGGKKDSHFWFYKRINFKQRKGYRLDLRITTAIRGWDASNPQFILYIDGEAICGLDINHETVSINLQGEHDLYLYAYTKTDEDSLLNLYAYIEYVDIEIENLYYNLYVPYTAIKDLYETEHVYHEILSYLNNAINMVDFTDFGDRFKEGVKQANKYLEEEFYGKYCKKTDEKVTCVGHTHIDLAWLWEFRQTREKAQRSFATVCALLDRYKDYTFMSSQVPLYEACKEEDPNLYKRIKEYISEGRWVPEGASYVEMDCNIPSGESLVRQIMYGKKFFKEEFGVDSKCLWLPDVFGYSAALPQILVKSGVDKFVTSKISWSETNTFPYDIFHWVGIDGTPILAHYLTTQDFKRERRVLEGHTMYNAKGMVSQIRGTYNRNQQKYINSDSLAAVGYGDGGGGTTPEDIEVILRTSHGIPTVPTARFRRIDEYLEEVKQSADSNPRTPKWVGELYLEMHRGTYTSQGKNKKNNRKVEFALANAENLSVLSSVLDKNIYKKDDFDKCWKLTLLNQFHDIIPGSSINEVYKQTDKDYYEIFNFTEDISNRVLTNLAKKFKDGQILVYNPNPHSFTGGVDLSGQRYYVKDIPAKGYKVVKIENTISKVKIKDRSLENKFFKVIFDDNLDIISVFDKEENRELLKEGKKIDFLLFENIPHLYANWEIERYYTEKKYDVDNIIGFEKVIEADRAGFKVTRQFDKSIITDTVYLYDKEKKIEFDDEADWKNDMVLLKREFPLDILTDKATCEIQFGNVERPTHQNTSWDEAKFEVCAHKYVDVSEAGYGVAIINDCKYGHSLVNNNIGLSLIKSNSYPDKEADKCKHSFKYAIVPHKHSVNDSNVANIAYQFNNPCLVIPCKGEENKLPLSYSLASVDKDNVFIDTIKPSEDGKGIILRLYEGKKTRSHFDLKLGFDVKEAYLCDLLENDIQKVDVKKNTVSLDIKPFEIITLRLIK